MQVRIRLAALLAALLTSVSAHALIGIGSYDTPGRALGVTVVGPTAFVADDSTGGVRVLDVSNPRRPTEIVSFDTPGIASAVAFDGSFAYVADGTGFRVFDLSDLGDIRLVDQLEGIGFVEDVLLNGSVAYLAAGSAGLRTVDVANPTNLSEIAAPLDTPGYAGSLHMVGDLIYVADHSAGVRIVDVSNPATPSEVASFDTIGTVRGVVVRDDFAYLADGTSGLRIFDLVAQGGPTQIAHLDTPGNAFGVSVDDDEVAYIADRARGISAIDVSNAAAPKLLATMDTSDLALDVHAAGSLLFVADHESGLRVFDKQIPEGPRQIGSLDTFIARGIAIRGETVFVADSNIGLRLIDVSDPAAPEQIGEPIDTSDARELEIVRLGEAGNDYAVVADGAAGLRLIDLSNTVSQYVLATAGAASSVRVSGEIAYVADDSGLRIADLSDPTNPSLIGSFDTPGFAAQDLAVSCDLVFLGDSNMLRVVDVSDPTEPAELEALHLPGIDGVFSVGAQVYVAYNGGLSMVDVSNPAMPTELSSVSLSGNVVRGRLDVVGSHVYASSGSAGVRVVGVDDLRRPLELGAFDTYDAHDVEVSSAKVNDAHGNPAERLLAYVADGTKGLKIIDFGPDFYPPPALTFDYPIGCHVRNVTSGLRPTRECEDHDGWHVPLGFSELCASGGGCPCPDRIHSGDDWNREGPEGNCGGNATADVNEAVRAVAAGVVARADDQVGTDVGDGVAVRHWLNGTDYYSIYVHIQRVPGVEEDSLVRRGQTIGTIQEFPRVSGPHLHFEMRDAFARDAAWWPNKSACSGAYYETLGDLAADGLLDPVVGIDSSRPECTDALDNDSDTWIDYSDDGGCRDAIDPTERRDCADDVDNDGDGATDFPSDPGCGRAGGHREDPECSDGIDNDLDGGIDFDGVLPDLDCDCAHQDTEIPPQPPGNLICGGSSGSLCFLVPWLWLSRRRGRDESRKLKRGLEHLPFSGLSQDAHSRPAEDPWRRRRNSSRRSGSA